jgi:hypothetical protein
LALTVSISTNDRSVICDLKDHSITDALSDELPLESRISTWGKEIYFPVPVETEPESLTLDIDIGDVAFWHEGQSLAIFFGPTPMSNEDGKPVPADDVEVIGGVSEGLSELDDFRAGEEITVKRVD